MNSPVNDTSKAVLVARAEASAWITKLHGPNRSPEMEEGFQCWLRERPENAAEFEGLTEVWDLVAGSAPARGVPRLERWERSAEAQELQALRETNGRRLPSKPQLWAAAAVVLLACGVVTFHLWPSKSYSTAVGEQRIVQLGDGSRVSLNSNSTLAVDYNKSARLLRLKQGEALFQVAKDPQRPFVVKVGGNRVTALGTSFLIRLEGDLTAVTLVDGKVAVHLDSPLSGIRPPSPDVERSGAHENTAAGQLSDQEIVLSPGQRLTLVAANLPKLDRPQLDTVTAWRRGEVVLNDTPLADAIAEMNRYDRTRIVIATPEIATLNVSGLYHTGDSEGFARSVARLHGLTMVEGGGQIRLER